MKFLLATILFTCNCIATAQTRFLDISINNNKIIRGDTIVVNAEYVDDFNEKINGTLYVKIVDDSAKKCWNFRWPIMNGLCSPKIVLGRDIPIGNYHMYFAARDEQFKLNCEMQNRTGFDELEAILYNNQTMVVTGPIKVPRNSQFEYTNPYFINAAILNFKNKMKQKQRPQIKITAVLDSAFTPTASKYIVVEFGAPFLNKQPNTLSKNYHEVSVQMNQRYRQLQTAIVKAKRRNNNRQENSELEKLIRNSFENSINDPWFAMEQGFDRMNSATFGGYDNMTEAIIQRVNTGTGGDEYGGGTNPYLLELRAKSLEAGFSKYVPSDTDVAAGKNTFIVKGYSAPVVSLLRTNMSDF